MAKKTVTQDYIKRGIIPAINYLVSIPEVTADFRLNHGLTKNARRINTLHEDFAESLKELNEKYMTEKYTEEVDGKTLEGIKVPEDKEDEYKELYEEINEEVEVDFYEIPVERFESVDANINFEAVRLIKGLIVIDKEEEKYIEELKAKESSPELTVEK